MGSPLFRRGVFLPGWQDDRDTLQKGQRDSEDEFYTVDSLIEEVKKSHYLSYYDEDIKDWVKEDKLTSKLEQKLRKFYSNIGDNNFYVHFG